MEQTFTADTEVSGDQLYGIVANLHTYPDWMALVDRVVPDPSGSTTEPAWTVTLKARVGPLARSKRLRMVRTLADGRAVRFERREADNRDHAPWVLAATVSARSESSSSVEIILHYGGSMWTGPLEVVLGRAADDAVAELQAYASGSAVSQRSDSGWTPR